MEKRDEEGGTSSSERERMPFYEDNSDISRVLIALNAACYALES